MSGDKHQQRCDTCVRWAHYCPSMAGIEFGWCCELEEYTEPEDGKDCIGWRSNKKPSKRERKIKRGMTVFMRSLNGKKDGGKR